MEDEVSNKSSYLPLFADGFDVNDSFAEQLKFLPQLNLRKTPTDEH